jgi:hypothetical protein
MRIHTGLGTALLALLLAVPATGATATPDAAGGNTASRGNGAEQRSARAEAALKEAQRLFQGGAGAASAPDERHARRTAAARHPKHATVVLRDLAVSLRDLDAEDRAVARRILARPTDGQPDAWTPAKYGDAPHTDSCTEQLRPDQNLCVHWVTDEASRHAPDLETDSDGDGFPDWVQLNQDVLEEVWQRVVADLGYRAPLPDGDTKRHGPDERTDIYLAELGGDGIYGYCTMDHIKDRAAYCVLDNDFEGFPASAEQSLRVTAAHEFFHAVQFAYNPFADFWLMEGTAAWVEDEVYDDINDNHQYLAHSALSCPGEPLDHIGPESECYPREPSHNWAYGSWIWWRFLTEYFADDGGTDPSVVRRVWQRLALDGAAQGSLQAQREVIRAQGTKLRNVFAAFGAANRIAPRWYVEGSSYRSYVTPVPRSGRFRLSKARRGTGWRATKLDHLSTRYAVIRPHEDLARRWRLRIVLDLPPRFRGSMATVIVHRRGGAIRTRVVELDRRGDARLGAAFDHRRIARVTLSLTNASSRVRDCNSDTTWSCGGVPVDDGLLFAFRARAVR